MLYRQLGKTGIKVSEIALGCASFWGKRIFSETKALNVVHQALDDGVSLFDTGHSYSNGHAEIRLGKALSHICDKSHLCISSKAGTRLDKKGRLFKDFNPLWIRKSCQQSIQNLGIESLGIFHLHGPNPEDFNDQLLNELLRLKQQGDVRSLAVNAFDEKIIAMALETGIFDVIMLDYNILSQHREPLIKQLSTSGMGVLAAAPLAGSLFSRRVWKIKGHKDLWYLARALKNSPKKIWAGRKFQFINQQKANSGSQLALAFVLNNPHISSAVFGTTDVKHLRENVKASGLQLSEELLEEILNNS